MRGRPHRLTATQYPPAVPELQAALLCDHAKDYNGLVSILGAFVSRVEGEMFPIRQQLWFVARVTWLPADWGRVQVMSLKVEHPDGEQLLRFDASTPLPPAPPADVDPDIPTGSSIVLPIAAEFRRPGVYRVILDINGEQVALLPLKVSARMPQL